jgi:hypothetical protein
VTESSSEASDGEPWAPLVDLSRVPVDRPVNDDDGVVDKALSRVLRSLHDRDGVISSFGSFVSDS